MTRLQFAPVVKLDCAACPGIQPYGRDVGVNPGETQARAAVARGVTYRFVFRQPAQRPCADFKVRIEIAVEAIDHDDAVFRFGIARTAQQFEGPGALWKQYA